MLFEIACLILIMLFLLCTCLCKMHLKNAMGRKSAPADVKVFRAIIAVVNSFIEKGELSTSLICCGDIAC